MTDSAVEIKEPPAETEKTVDTDTSPAIRAKDVKGGLLGFLRLFKGREAKSAKEAETLAIENQKQIDEIRSIQLGSLSIAAGESPSAYTSADNPRLQLKWLERIKELGGVNALTPKEFDRRARLIAQNEAGSGMNDAKVEEVKARLVREEGYGQPVNGSETIQKAEKATDKREPESPPKPSGPFGSPIGEKSPA